MIISHRHKFVFLHCRKTAGTSITCYLNKFLGPRDIQIGAWSDTLKHGGRYNRQFYVDLIAHRYGVSFAKELARSVIDMRRPRFDVISRRMHVPTLGIQPGHSPASAVQAAHPDAFNNYFKFCFVRNPYEKVYSDYRWRVSYKRKDPEKFSFLDFLKLIDAGVWPDAQGILSAYPDNWPIYTIDDRIAVDFIGRYECFESDMEKVCHILGIPFDLKSMVHAKKPKGERPDFRKHYGTAERDIVERVFAKELSTFNYTFDKKPAPLA